MSEKPELRALEPIELVAAINATLKVWKHGAYGVDAESRISFKEAAKQVLEGVNLLRGAQDCPATELVSS